MVNLSPLHSFAFDYQAASHYIFDSVDALKAAATDGLFDKPHLVLGSGTNTVFTQNYSGNIVSMGNDNISLTEDSEHFLLSVDAGLDWHQLVQWCMARQIYGLENLALIPGSVGAAPIQNIGAYGVELSDVCYRVEYFDKQSLKLLCLGCDELAFGYRDSVFKNSLKQSTVITRVELKIKKRWQGVNHYQGLEDTLTPQQIYDAVIRERRRKLPDHQLIPNAGSFFKNPVLDNTFVTNLKAQYDTLPVYPVCRQYAKTSAAWLIEQCGLKGKQLGGVGVYQKHALILVNLGNGNGEQLRELIATIIAAVQAKFGIMLEQEVQVI